MYVETLVQELVRRQAQQVPGKQHMTDAEMWVTPEVWQQVIAHVRAASRLIHSEAQPPRSPGTVHVNLSMVGFRMGDALA